MSREYTYSIYTSSRQGQVRDNAIPRNQDIPPRYNRGERRGENSPRPSPLRLTRPLSAPWQRLLASPIATVHCALCTLQYRRYPLALLSSAGPSAVPSARVHRNAHRPVAEGPAVPSVRLSVARGLGPLSRGVVSGRCLGALSLSLFSLSLFSLFCLSPARFVVVCGLFVWLP